MACTPPKPPVFKCSCGTAFKPTSFPYVRNCPCGAQITVNKPAKEGAK